VGVIASGSGRSFTGDESGKFIPVGKLGREVQRDCYKLIVFGSQPQELKKCEALYVMLDGVTTKLRIKRLVVRAKTSTCCFYPEEISALKDELSGQEVFMADTERAVVANGEYYVNDLVGCDVYVDNGEQLGLLHEVLRTGANDVYVVKDDAGKETLVPAVNDIIVKVDIPKKKVIVHLMDEVCVCGLMY
jgi:16S rRNA processing protein RimM